MPNVDVIAWIRANSGTVGRDVLYAYIRNLNDIYFDRREVVCHAILEYYRWLPKIPECDLMRTACRQLIRKYMANSVATKQEQDAYTDLVNEAVEAGEDDE